MIIMTSIRSHISETIYVRLSEWMLAIHLILLAFILVSNKTLMTNGLIDYAPLLTITNQAGWAKILIILGTARLIILIVNGAYRRSPHLRALSAALSCFIWFQVAVAFYATFGWAFAAYAVATVSDLMNIMRCMRDARMVDDAHKRGASGEQN